jgi:exoribonuclease II
VVDALSDAELTLVYAATDPEAFVDVESILQAVESYRAFRADALGDLLLLILVGMEELL